MAYLILELQASAGAVRLWSLYILILFLISLTLLLVQCNLWQAYFKHCRCLPIGLLSHCCYFSSAKVIVQLASSDCIQAAVMFHPSFVTQDEMKGTLH